MKGSVFSFVLLILTYPGSILGSGICKILLVLLAAVERRQFRHWDEHSIQTKSPTGGRGKKRMSQTDVGHDIGSELLISSSWTSSQHSYQGKTQLT